jgi:hypothetical protein
LLLPYIILLQAVLRHTFIGLFLGWFVLSMGTAREASKYKVAALDTVVPITRHDEYANDE